MPAVKCVRPGYSFDSVTDGAFRCNLRTVLFKAGGLMWSCSPTRSNSGARAGLLKLIFAGEPGLRPSNAASKNARFAPGM